VELKTPRVINSDVLVIGGGAAGLRAAIEARKYGLDVMLISESLAGFRNNTAISGATFAASGVAKETNDSSEVHLKDTITAGCFINDQKLVATMTLGAAQQVYDLVKFGVNFRQHHGEPVVWQIPGHTYPRHVIAERFRGINISRPMRQYAARIGIPFIEGVLVTKLLQTEGTVVGALGIDNKGRVLVIGAKSTVLAAGGAGHLYLRTSNAIGAAGDGYALAYAVGAALRDMEFVQFYPTTRGKHGSKLCAYETFMPRGATIRNYLGEDILKKHGMDNFTKATRDTLTKVIMKEIIGGRGIEGSVVFDFTTMPEETAEKLYLRGFPPQFSVAPAVHFFMGGIKINVNGETGINALYAAGEVCGGIHGANRLGGNAITETLVFGAIAGDKAADRASKAGPVPVSRSEVKTEVERLKELASTSGQENMDQLKRSLKQTMWDKVGVIRDRESLGDALTKILALREQLKRVSLRDYRQLLQAVKLTNMLIVSEMICRAALTRTESRGAHYRADYPEEDNEQWLKTIEISRQNGEMTLSIIPVSSDK
jgi:succinate dehydrogenase/fumarate reductase flavoprotein subunit